MAAWRVLACECASVFRCGARLLEGWVLPGFDRGSPQIRSKSAPEGMAASLRGKWDIFTRTKSASNWPQRALCTSNQQPTATSRTQTQHLCVLVCPSRPREVKRGPSVRVSVTNCTFPHKVSNRTPCSCVSLLCTFGASPKLMTENSGSATFLTLNKLN